jgi:hypothetical protein
MSHNSTVSKQYMSRNIFVTKKPVTKHMTFKTVLKKILFCLSSSVFPVLPVPFCLSCSACPVLPVLFCLFCPDCLVLLIQLWTSFSACPVFACPVQSVVFCMSCSACPVLTFLSLLYIYIYIYIRTHY